MKYVIIVICIICMIVGVFISANVGVSLGFTDYNAEHNHPDTLPRPVEDVRADLESEMLKSNAMLDGLHWLLNHDKALWQTRFVESTEYKSIDRMVEWGDYDSINWKAKDSLSNEDFVRTHY